MMRKCTAALLVVGCLLTGVRADSPPKNSEFEKCTFTNPAGKQLPYRLLKPEGYDPSAMVTYPLVIFLHGIGERGSDNEAQLLNGVREFAKPEIRKKHPCFVIAPQCPAEQFWITADRKGFDIIVKMPKAPAEPLGLVHELMDSLPAQYHIDQTRIYATGLSMGGFGTWDMLARWPDRFAAAIPVCGGGYEPAVPNFAKIPIWVFHGGADPLVKAAYSRTMVDAIRKAGGKPGYTEYPGVGHESWVQTYRNPDVLEWLFAQKKD